MILKRLLKNKESKAFPYCFKWVCNLCLTCLCSDAHVCNKSGSFIYLRGTNLKMRTSLVATASTWKDRPRFGANATSCTASVTVTSVSALAYFLVPEKIQLYKQLKMFNLTGSRKLKANLVTSLYSYIWTLPPYVTLLSSLPTAIIGAWAREL